MHRQCHLGDCVADDDHPLPERVARTRARRGYLSLLGLWIVTILSACSEPASTDEQQILAWLERIETSVEQRDGGAITEAIDADYQDSKGNDRQAIARMIQILLIRNRSPHLFIKPLNIEITDARFAALELLVAMANTPMFWEDDALRARAHKVHLSLRRDSDDWRVTQAHWERAGLDDWR